MRKFKALLFILLLIPAVSQAATGSVLFNCTFDGPGSTPAQVWVNCGGSASFGSLGLSSATIVSGAGHDGGKAISFYYPYTGTHHELYDPMGTQPLNKSEITVVYWERFDVDPSVSSNWNVKGSRVFSSSSDGQAYIGGINALTGSGNMMQSHIGGGSVDPTMTTTSAVTFVAGPPNYSGPPDGYCKPVSGKTYSCGNYARVNWAPGYGKSWHKVREYLKSPTNPSAQSNDGVIMVWIDDVLLYTLTNVNGKTTSDNVFKHVSFHPSDDFWDGQNPNSFTFHHLYDDITIYEGYVPPTGSSTPPTPPLSQPSYSK